MLFVLGLLLRKSMRRWVGVLVVTRGNGVYVRMLVTRVGACVIIGAAILNLSLTI